MKLHVLLLTALPMCLAQFSIQGPSDGHRRAQGLKFSSEKGLEYTEASEGGGAGDFSIQGATDGNSNFNIQGATDGHTNFQIQGASDGGAATFIQGAYDANQGGGNGKALQYDDPSGYRVNWKSYERQAQPQAEQQYAAQAPAPQARHRARQPQPRPQPQRQQVAEPTPNYKPYNNAPPQIQQLLQFQQDIPYINVIPEQFRFDAEAAIQEQSKQVHEHYRQLAQQPARSPAQEPAPAPAPAPERRHKSRGHSRSRREANPQKRGQLQYRVTQETPEPQPQYSTNLPSHLQELLKYQSQIPYNIFANQVAYRGSDKPYVPQPVQPQQQQQQQQPQLQQAQYQGQGGAFEAQASAYTQAQVANYPSQQQSYNQQQGYNQQQQQAGVRPVTENQY